MTKHEIFSGSWIFFFLKLLCNDNRVSQLWLGRSGLVVRAVMDRSSGLSSGSQRPGMVSGTKSQRQSQEPRVRSPRSSQEAGLPLQLAGETILLYRHFLELLLGLNRVPGPIREAVSLSFRDGTSCGVCPNRIYIG